MAAARALGGELGNDVGKGGRADHGARRPPFERRGRLRRRGHRWHLEVDRRRSELSPRLRYRPVARDERDRLLPGPPRRPLRGDGRGRQRLPRGEPRLLARDLPRRGAPPQCRRRRDVEPRRRRPARERGRLARPRESARPAADPRRRLHLPRRRRRPVTPRRDIPLDRRRREVHAHVRPRRVRPRPGPVLSRRRLRRIRHRRRLRLLCRAGRCLALGRLRPHVVALPDARFSRRTDPRAAGPGEGDDLGHGAAGPLRLRPRRGRRPRRRRDLPVRRRGRYVGEADRPPGDVPEGRLQPVRLRPHAPRPPGEARPPLPRHRQPLRLHGRRGDVETARRGLRRRRLHPPRPARARHPRLRSRHALGRQRRRPLPDDRRRRDVRGLQRRAGPDPVQRRRLPPLDTAVPDGRDAGQREPEDPRRPLLVRPDRQRRRLRPRPAGRPGADPRGELLRLPELLDDDRRSLPRRHADSRPHDRGRRPRRTDGVLPAGRRRARHPRNRLPRNAAALGERHVRRGPVRVGAPLDGERRSRPG